MVRDTPPKIRRGIYCFRMFLNYSDCFAVFMLFCYAKWSPPFFKEEYRRSRGEVVLKLMCMPIGSPNKIYLTNVAIAFPISAGDSTT